MMQGNSNNSGSQKSSRHLNRRALQFVIGLILVAIGSYGYKVLNHGIFACPADGYQDGWYFAYCNSTAYGDYDHGALWYPMEPETAEFASHADVLVVGSSRMQYGFSSDQTDSWFAERNLTHYLLGFSHTETVRFMQPLMEKIKPRARVVVINADGFFENRITEPVATLFTQNDAASRYRAKKRWQKLHQAICQKLPAVCGRSPGFYRKQNTGRWIQYGENPNWRNTPSAEAPASTQDWSEDLALATEFMQSLDVAPECVVLTIVPSPATPVHKARWLAEQLQIKLVLPQVSGFTTRDNSHLDVQSAERWSKAFFEQAGPAIERCTQSGTT